jgi:hypothetical protein
MGQQLTKQLQSYQNNGASATDAMSNLMGTWGSDRMGGIAKALDGKGNPLAGPVANLHAIASESAAYGAQQ